MHDVPILASHGWTCQDRARRGYLTSVSACQFNLVMASQWHRYADHVIAGPAGRQVYLDRAQEYQDIAHAAYLDSIAYASI